MKDTLEKVKEMLENLKETEELILIGKATKFAMRDGSRFTAFNGTIEDLLRFYNIGSED